ncbi:MAG: prolipoprotein diacylglyceryl transferase [Deltaproteobacteria bacterium]|nr:prolipoprotein diacylglyceryl transferase [Deltaproteobacteria bacterium]
MHPILFKLGAFQIHTYGVMAAIGFLAALLWVRYDSKKSGLPVATMTDFAFAMIFSGVIGTRVFYVLQNWELFRDNPIDVFKIWQGGLVWYGGLLVAGPIAVYYLRKKHLSFWKVGDIMAPALSVGHAFGRLGCFAAGCCFGKPAQPQAWYAVIFHPIEETLAPTGVPLYPTQLMESAAEFALFLFLIGVVRRYKAFDGMVFLSYLILYSIVRSLIEILRGDIERKFVFENLFGQVLSTSQFISGILFVLAFVLMALLYQARKTK